MIDVTVRLRAANLAKHSSPAPNLGQSPSPSHCISPHGGSSQNQWTSFVTFRFFVLRQFDTCSNFGLGHSLKCETFYSKRRAHFPTTNNIHACYPPDQSDWLSCAQSCSSLYNGVTHRKQGSAGHGTHPRAGGKCPIDYKPFPTATTRRLAFFISLTSILLMCI
jgi:hypothetical protein